MVSPLAVRKGVAMYVLVLWWAACWAGAYWIASTRFAAQLPAARLLHGPSRRALAAACLLPVPCLAALSHLSSLSKLSAAVALVCGREDVRVFGMGDVALRAAARDGIRPGYMVFCAAVAAVATAAGAARVLTLGALDGDTPFEVASWSAGAAALFSVAVAARTLVREDDGGGGGGAGGQAGGALACAVGAAERAAADVMAHIRARPSPRSGGTPP